MVRRLLPLTLAAAALLVVLPAEGSAGPVSVQAIGIQIHGSFSVYVTGSAETDHVTVSKPASDSWRVTAPGGVVALSECGGATISPYQTCGCSSVNAATATCTSPSRGQVIAQLFGGTDTIRANEFVALWALGGKGHDRLGGAELSDRLFGREGGDRLVGHGGPDRIDGGPGHDAILGGGGDDILDAQNSDRDRVINCGAGQDRVYVDPKLDTPAANCENVRPH
jgi:hypothetical protein